ncbi:MAG TPA: hypothetical protein VEN79_05345 [Terriglobia bacterium]|nr:hypothetical protein [Terriglobia bacterium]
MIIAHNPKLRLGVCFDEVRFEPTIQNTPPLPIINWDLVGRLAPILSTTPPGSLPKADVVMLTWAGAEWAGIEHVFCGSSATMPYSKRNEDSWSGWQKWDKSLAEVVPIK